MLLDQKRTKRWVRIFAVIASIGFVGALIPILVIVIFQGGGKSPEELRQEEIAQARAAAEANPRDAAAWDTLAQALLADDPAAAVAPARRAARLTPRNYDRVETLALALDGSGKTDVALKELQAFTARSPRNAEGFFLLGQLAEKLGRTALASLAYQAVVRLEPGGGSTSLEAQARLDALTGTPTTTTPTTPTTRTGTGPVTP
ncbi:MAG: tetratricopeptide repeat protein [Actinomycetota bacterium]